MFKQLLQEKKVPVTKQRIAILEALYKNKKPLTVDSLLKLLDAKMNRTTLYRSLDLMVSLGIVYQTDFRNGVAYFELQSNHHHHFMCTECKTFQDIDVCPTSFFADIQEKQGVLIRNHVFEIFGLCKLCLKK